MTEQKKTQALAIVQTGPLAELRQKFSREQYNVLAPVTHMELLPAGTRLAVTEVRINPDPAAKEVFPIAGGGLMPSKVSLDRIAAAAGISWLEERRQDNGKHPHYCEMFVRGRITDFDGTVRECAGVKAIDLREDAGGGEMGKDYAEVIGKAKKANRDPSGQLMEARKFIQEIAASKAKNRAIASALGIKRSYTREELVKPFIVPKLTVDTADKAVAQVVVANMLGATEALYGSRQLTGRVVNAEFEEAPGVEPSDPAGQGSAGGAQTPAEPASASGLPDLEDAPEVDEQTGERRPPDENEVRARAGAAYAAIRKSKPKITPAEWTAFVRKVTGKKKYEEMGWVEFDALDEAVSAFGGREPGAEG